jgi:hypothetical protein
VYGNVGTSGPAFKGEDWDDDTEVDAVVQVVEDPPFRRVQTAPLEPVRRYPRAATLPFGSRASRVRARGCEVAELVIAPQARGRAA